MLHSTHSSVWSIWEPRSSCTQKNNSIQCVESLKVEKTKLKCNWDFNLQTLCITRGPILYHIKYFNIQSLKIEKQMWNANLRFQPSNSMHSHSKPLASACIILLTSSTNHHELHIEIIVILGKARDFWIPAHTLKVVIEEAMKQWKFLNMWLMSNWMYNHIELLN